ncbi:GNAT family N-acetyltransferase [Flavobacteriaceae bacterium TP-CH-4]|uniref:GNAT family N-acetyltransferase n=1 Tax=Pelagihabitans pacificus TaxID=2696054 RepID=A0A967AVM3_9FLAO|nr:GNAT family N-acetyltransferase [Pelagihabitans pacificus]
MKIENSKPKDIDVIFERYRVAADFQRSKFLKHIWPEFDRKMVETEIRELRQFKIVVGETIACVWAVTFNDPEIWGAHDRDPSVYIHRIAVHPDFRGHNFVRVIVRWAKNYAVSKNRKFIRLDTCGNNKRLIKHYTTNGFKFLGIEKLPYSEALPAHYHDADVCRFEIAL